MGTHENLPLDPDTEISIETVKERSVRGIVVLTGRTFFLQVLGFVAVGFLAAYLHAYEWGVFAIVNAVINFLNYFSDIGLAAALIQKKEKPSDTDLKTTFFVQEILVLVIIGIMIVFSQIAKQKFSLNGDGLLLYYAVAFSFLISSFKSIPSILLERKLEFVKLTFPQIIEQVVYYLVLVVFAIKGYSLKSFVFAVIARDIVGVILLYIFQPWRPGIAFSKATLKDLFKFGIPYQINTFLAAFKDDGKDILIGSILGPIPFGYLAFAIKFARYPLTFFMDTVTKVAFPAFSRLRSSPKDLETSVTRYIFFICFLVFPSLVGIVTLGPELLNIIPKYNQWLPAATAILFVSINFGFAAATTLLTNLLNAIGKIKITFYLMIMWTFLTWLTIPILSIKFGLNGAAFGYSIVGASSIVAIYVTKKYVNFSILDSMIKPLIGATLMGTVLIILRNVMQANIYSLGILVVVGILVYGAVMVSMVGVSLIEDARKSFKTILGR